MLNTVLSCVSYAQKYGGGIIRRTVRACGMMLLCGTMFGGGLVAQESSRLFYRVVDPSGSKAGGNIGSDKSAFSNGQVYCKDQDGATLLVWLENAGDTCIWTGTNVSFSKPYGRYGDTVSVVLNASNTEMTNVSISVKEGTGASVPKTVAVVVPRRAAKVAPIKVLDLLEDTAYCEGLKYTAYVAEDANYTETVNNYDKTGGYPEANLRYRWLTADNSEGVGPYTVRDYTSDPKEMYLWETPIYRNATLWLVQPRTCETTVINSLVSNEPIRVVIPTHLTDDNLSVLSIRYSEGDWDTTGSPDYKYACSWYSSAFNSAVTDYTDTTKNAIGGFNDGERENGYVYLQAMPYRPNDLTYRNFQYEWHYDEDALEPAVEKMNSPFYVQSGFGIDKPRICFRVKNRPEGTDPAISVWYKMYCGACNTRAESQGSSNRYESKESAPVVLTRVDSIVSEKVKYIAEIRDEFGMPVEILDDALPRLCGKKEYQFCGKTLENGDGGQTFYRWLLPSGWIPQDKEASGCAIAISPAIIETDTKIGDTIHAWVMPSNYCFANGRDTSRIGQYKYAFLRSVPQAPRIVDTIAAKYYTGYTKEQLQRLANEGEGTGPGNEDYVPWPMEGVPNPLLLCNNTYLGLNVHSLGSEQAFLLHTPNNPIKPNDYDKHAEEKSGFVVKFPKSDGDEKEVLEGAFKIESYNGKTSSDTNVLVFRINLAKRQALVDKKQIVMSVAAANECGEGYPNYFAVNVIDTISVIGHVQDNDDPEDFIYDTVSKCEGIKMNLRNESSLSELYDRNEASPDRNTDRLEYCWKIPSSWRFDNPVTGPAADPITSVWIGQEKGSVRLALKNRCGMGKYRQSDSINVNPYTRVDIKVVDGFFANSEALNPKIPADKDKIDKASLFLLDPCQASFMMYAADTCERTDRYRWEFPQDWQLEFEDGYTGTAEPVPGRPNMAYTQNDVLNSVYHDMRVKVKVGADTGNIYVVGAKEACAWTFDNYAPNLQIDPPHYGHRRDSLKAVVRPFTAKPVEAFPWPDSVCVRNPLTLRVKPDPTQDSLTRANTYFTWIIPSDYGMPDHTVAGDETATQQSVIATFTIPDRVGDYDTILVISHREDCDAYNIGDTLVHIYKLTDTIPFAPKSYIRDIRKPGSLASKTPCEGDTVWYQVLPDTKRYLDSVWWTWDGENRLEDTLGGIIDLEGGWRVLNRPGHYADTLQMIVGRTPLSLGAQAVSMCGMSSVLSIDLTPISLVRDKTHLVEGRTVLCEGEKVVFEWDSVNHATQYEWFFPWGNLTDTLTIDNKMFYREFSRRTLYEKGFVYVRPGNVCGAGPYSDTVTVSSIIKSLGVPSLKTLDPETVFVPVNDTVCDTVCLRTVRYYEASFTDNAYDDNTQWRYRWIPFLLDAADSLRPESPEVFTDSSRYAFANYDMAKASKYFGVAVHHAQCATLGDTLVVRLQNADTVAFDGDLAGLNDHLRDWASGKPVSIQTRPCGQDTVEWHFESGITSEKVKYRFVWWNENQTTGLRDWNAADSMMAGTGFKWLNPQDQTDKEDELWFEEDVLRMRVGNGQTLNISVDVQSRCGIARLPAVSVHTVVSIKDSMYRLQQLSPIVCDGDSLRFEIQSSNSIGGFEWHYPWGKQVDSVNDGQRVIRTFTAGRYEDGYVYAVPYNGCGYAKNSDSIRIQDIFRLPAKAVPANFAPDYDPDKDAWASDTLCMRTRQVLKVAFNDWQENTDYQVHWQKISGSEIGFNPGENTDSCVLSQESLALQSFVLEVSSRVKGCRRYSDTLTIRVFPMDTLSFAVKVVEDEDLAPFEVLSPAIVLNRGNGLPIDRNPCGNVEQQYTLASDIHWSVSEGFMPYFSWLAKDGSIQTAPDAGLSMGGSDWIYKGEILPEGENYRNLPLLTGAKDILNLYVNLHNRCGSSRSPAFAVKPKPTVSDKPRIQSSPVCLDKAVGFDCDAVENAEEYHWTFPWEPRTSVSGIPHVDIPKVSDINGNVIVKGKNGCGFGPADTLKAVVIHSPKRPVPAWKENGISYKWDADTVTETICLHGESIFRVTRDPRDADGQRYNWKVGAGDKLEIIPVPGRPDSICTLRPSASAVPGDEALLKVWGYYSACGGAGDTLFIRVGIIDTLPIAALGSRIVVLPSEYQTQNNPCPEEELTLRVENDAAPAYRWMLPATWRFKDSDTTGASVTVVVGNTRGSVRVFPLSDPSVMGCNITYPNPLRSIEYIPRSVPQTPEFAVSFTEHPCVGNVVVYQLASSDAAVVQQTPARWVFPADWVVQGVESDQQTEGANIWPVGNFSCSVLVGKDSGDVRAYQLDSCGDRLVRGTERSRAVNPIDTARIRVWGDQNVCLDSTVFLTVEALNAYARADGYNLEVEYMDQDDTPLQISFPDGGDSSYIKIVCHSRDTVRLVFTPKNTYCAQNTLPFVHYIIADTVPSIGGVITGQERICADNRYEYVFHIDPEKAAMFDSISYTWKVPHTGWRILSGQNDTTVVLYFDSIPSDPQTGLWPRTTDTIECYPRAGCGTAFPTRFVVNIQPQDVFDDSILIDRQNPCLGTDLEVELQNKGRYDTDTIRFVWNTPTGWQRYDSDSLPQTSYKVQYDTASLIQVRYLRKNSCGLSQRVGLWVKVKDSASKAVFDGIPYPCYTRDRYEVAIAPDADIDSVFWTWPSSITASVHSRPDSRIKDDSLSIDNVSHSVSAIALQVRSFNECGSRDTVLIVTPVTSTTPFTDTLHATRFCLSDTGHVYISLSPEQQKEGFYFRWNFPDSSYRVLNASVPGDTVAVLSYRSDSSSAGTELVLQSGNDCKALADQQIYIVPFTYAISAVSESSQVHYGRSAVMIEVKNTTAGDPAGFTYVWKPENRFNPNGKVDTSWRLTGRLVQAEECFAVEARQKMQPGEEELAFYLRPGRCRAADTVRIAVDSLFSLITESGAATCVDMWQELTVRPFGGNLDNYHISWWRFRESDEEWEEMPEKADSLRIQINEQQEGDYLYRAIGWDSTYVYADTLFLSEANFVFDTVPVLVASHFDTALLYVSAYVLDIQFGNVASDRIAIPVGSRVEIETRVHDGTGHYTYQWKPENLIMRVDSNSGNMRTYAIFHADELQLTVTDDASGCVAERRVHIDMTKESDIPNVFTPNGDGKNDVFLKGVAELTIYTRWGEEIFHDLTGGGWDGTYKGKIVRPGEYMYVAGVSDENGKKFVFKGVVTVKY